MNLTFFELFSGKWAGQEKNQNEMTPLSVAGIRACLRKKEILNGNHRYYFDAGPDPARLGGAEIKR
ncbi:MAG: hypothetical protein CMJ47_06465 [Planctomyces sp.]|nr:hypothetical protein [Planctomyces sp.]